MSGFLFMLPDRAAAALEQLSGPSLFTLFDFRLHASALSRPSDAISSGFWLMHVAEGCGQLIAEGERLALSPGELLYGRFGRRIALEGAAGLRLHGAFLPLNGSGARLTSLPSRPMILSGAGGSAFLGALLAAAVSRLQEMTEEELGPLEISILEFLTTAVAARSRETRLLSGSTAKNALARRAMQTADLLLSSPDLNPGLIAERIGISLRYLQQLFEAMGENPNHYIRRRRLERCHRDLTDGLYAAQSISEISYRWGFNDAAYFSRSFREVYGLSPSEHRGRARPAATRRAA